MGSGANDPDPDRPNYIVVDRTVFKFVDLFLVVDPYPNFFIDL